MTLRELFSEMVVAKRRNDRQYESVIHQAWHTANFTASAWAGKLKPLGEIMDKLKRPPLAEQDKVAQRGMLYKIAAHCGRDVKRTRLIRVHG